MPCDSGGRGRPVSSRVLLSVVRACRQVRKARKDPRNVLLSMSNAIKDLLDVSFVGDLGDMRRCGLQASHVCHMLYSPYPKLTHLHAFLTLLPSGVLLGLFKSACLGARLKENLLFCIRLGTMF